MELHSQGKTVPSRKTTTLWDHSFCNSLDTVLTYFRDAAPHRWINTPNWHWTSSSSLLARAWHWRKWVRVRKPQPSQSTAVVEKRAFLALLCINSGLQCSLTPHSWSTVRQGIMRIDIGLFAVETAVNARTSVHREADCHRCTFETKVMRAVLLWTHRLNIGVNVNCVVSSSALDQKCCRFAWACRTMRWLLLCDNLRTMGVGHSFFF